jgi:hypothetical protein
MSDIEDEAYALLEDARQMEADRRFREALVAYDRIATKYSETPEGRNAQQRLTRLRAKMAGNHDA